MPMFFPNQRGRPHHALSTQPCTPKSPVRDNDPMATQHPYTVNYVCSGNICRSPIGEVTLRAMLDEAGIGDQVRVISSGTGDWHVGDPADHRTVDVLEKHGYDGSQHRATQFDPTQFEEYDLVLAADYGHERVLNRLARTDDDRKKIQMLRSFDPESVSRGELEVPDPYLGTRADFENVIDQVTTANRHLVDYIAQQLKAN